MVMFIGSPLLTNHKDESMTTTNATMTSFYQELLKKAYIRRLRNQKDGNSILGCLDAIYEDYNKETQPQGWDVVDTTSDN